MKKISRFLLLSFSFIMAFIVFSVSENVEAKNNILYQTNEVFEGCKREDQVIDNEDANFWETICTPHQVLSGYEDNLGKYNYSEAWHNFTFQYDYKLLFDVDEGFPLKDVTTFVNVLYAITEPTTITYTNIDTNTQYNRPETFQVYKYRAGLTNTFE